MSGSRMGVGQHRASYGPAVNNGQRNVRGTAGDVGMESGGERQNGPVPGSVADSMIDMTVGAENSPFYDSVVRRKR